MRRAETSEIGDEPGSLNEPDATVVPRLLCALGVAGLLWANLGVAPAGYWLSASMLGEGLVWLSAGPFRKGGAGTSRQKVLNAAAVLLQTTVWTVPSVLFWLTAQPALLAVAVGILSVQLFHASTFAYRDGVSLFICGAPPAAAMLALPVFFASFPPTLHVTLVLGAFLAVAYAGLVARINLRMLQALKVAQEDLRGLTARAQAANTAKSEFLAHMSHELRTPMNGVLGMAHALNTTSLDAAQQRHVDMMIESGGGLLAILNDILDLSKVEAGKLELGAEAFDLRESVRQIGHVWAEIARGRDVELRVRIAPDAATWVLGDPLRFRQILTNLVSNAVKFTSHGEVVIALTASERTSDVVLEVSDTGPGIDAPTLGRLFSAFTQADASIARKFGGTGLGLSISRNLARLMGGDISVTSELGKGATFRVTLPLPPVAQPAAAPDPDRPATSLVGARVLVVEDNHVNRAVVQAILGAAGVVVDLAADGLKALEALRIERFDLVLMDVHMPVMDGLEATSRIRRGEAGDPRVPIIALTADAMTGERERLLAMGFDDLHPKPISPGDLLAGIAQALARGPSRSGAPNDTVSAQVD